MDVAPPARPDAGLRLVRIVVRLMACQFGPPVDAHADSIARGEGLGELQDVARRLFDQTGQDLSTWNQRVLAVGPGDESGLRAWLARAWQASS
jgi:hypothetical protein